MRGRLVLALLWVGASCAGLLASSSPVAGAGTPGCSPAKGVVRARPHSHATDAVKTDLGAGARVRAYVEFPQGQEFREATTGKRGIGVLRFWAAYKNAGTRSRIKIIVRKGSQRATCAAVMVVRKRSA